MKKILLVISCCALLFGCNKNVLESNNSNDDNQNNTTEKEPVNTTKDDNQNNTTEKEPVNTTKDGTLICRKDTTASVTFETEMNYTFKNDKIDSVKVKYTYDLSSYTKDQRKAFASAELCKTDSVKTTLGMNDCSERLDGTNYIVSGTAEKLKSMVYGNLELNKSSLESDKWICEVK